MWMSLTWVSSVTSNILGAMYIVRIPYPLSWFRMYSNNCCPEMPPHGILITSVTNPHTQMLMAITYTGAKCNFQLLMKTVVIYGHWRPNAPKRWSRDLFCDADNALFHKILYNKANLLHMYLPDRSQIVYTLCNRNHNKILIPKTSDLNERHFLIRVLYKHCYWL